MKIRQKLVYVGLLIMTVFTLAACSNQKSKNGKITIVTTTNVYSDIAKQIAGKYGDVSAIITKSATDPHDFEPTTNDAKRVNNADIVVANGMGYDNWMNKLAKSVNKKPVLVGEDLMHLKHNDNPHIWYNLTMPKKYTDYLVKRLSKLDKKHAAYFKNNQKKYLAKIDQIRQIAKKADGKNKKPVFVSEPVFDYALEEAGYKIGDKDFEEAIENGTDPSPKMIGSMTNAIKQKKIAFFVNNTQASSSTVNTFVKLAKQNKIPVLNVRETIPDNTSYLAWMKQNYQALVNVSR